MADFVPKELRGFVGPHASQPRKPNLKRLTNAHASAEQELFDLEPLLDAAESTEARRVRREDAYNDELRRKARGGS